MIPAARLGPIAGKPNLNNTSGPLRYDLGSQLLFFGVLNSPVLEKGLCKIVNTKKVPQGRLWMGATSHGRYNPVKGLQHRRRKTLVVNVR